jgi:hypothetical protein
VTTATRGEAFVDISATAGLVYAIVADVTRMGERSPECYRCEWLDGATQPAVGARFKGFNRLGLLRWSTTCRVDRADPAKEFAFTVLSGKGREETRWRYVLEDLGETTRLTESYEFLWCPALARVAEIPFPRDKQLRRGLARTLDRVKAAAEQSPAVPGHSNDHGRLARHAVTQRRANP